MFELSASKVFLNVIQRETVTSGSVNVYLCQFQFDDSWSGLERTAVFQSGDDKVSVLLDGTNQCQIPWEVLENPRRTLEAGVYGTKDGNVVLPTIWASLGTIKEGVSLGETSQPPTPSLYEQILAEIGNLDDLNTTAKDSLVSAINELWATGGGGGTGSGNVSSPDISSIRVMDKADYDDLESKDENTLYLIRG